jgi:hypothetical protein
MQDIPTRKGIRNRAERTESFIIEANFFLEPIIDKLEFHYLQRYLMSIKYLKIGMKHALSRLLLCPSCKSYMSINWCMNKNYYMGQDFFREQRNCKPKFSRRISQEVAESLVLQILTAFVAFHKNKL